MIVLVERKCEWNLKGQNALLREHQKAKEYMRKPLNTRGNHSSRGNHRDHEEIIKYSRKP